MAIKLGLQIPNFSYGTGVAEIFPTVIAQAQEAEAAGFDSVFVMDHFYQLPGLGDARGADAGGLHRPRRAGDGDRTCAARHARHRQHLPQPDAAGQGDHHARRDQSGRAVLGIGTGWFELEHDPLGYEFGTFTDRFNKLDEALQIILPMLRGERATVAGKYYRTQEAIANPRFRDHIPLMIGGSGEKKTIPLAAKYFDHLNIIAGFDELPRKVQVVKDRCEEIGRDPATLETSVLAIALIDENITADMIPDDFKQQAVFGGPEQIVDQIKTKVLDAGVDGVILSSATIERLPARWHHRGRRAAEAGAGATTADLAETRHHGVDWPDPTTLRQISRAKSSAVERVVHSPNDESAAVLLDHPDHQPAQLFEHVVTADVPHELAAIRLVMPTLVFQPNLRLVPSQVDEHRRIAVRHRNLSDGSGKSGVDQQQPKPRFPWRLGTGVSQRHGGASSLNSSCARVAVGKREHGVRVDPGGGGKGVEVGQRVGSWQVASKVERGALRRRDEEVAEAV